MRRINLHEEGNVSTELVIKSNESLTLNRCLIDLKEELMGALGGQTAVFYSAELLF